GDGGEHQRAARVRAEADRDHEAEQTHDEGADRRARTDRVADEDPGDERTEEDERPDHTVTRPSRSANRFSPIPPPSRSWSTRVKPPRRSRSRRMAAASVGPMPGRVSRSSLVAVLRLIGPSPGSAAPPAAADVGSVADDGAPTGTTSIR